MTTASLATTTHRRRGLPLPLPALAFAALMIASVAVSAAAPRATASGAAVLAYDQAHLTALRVAAFLQIGSAIPLAVWAAAAVQRLRALGINAAPGPLIGLVGGALAAGSLTLLGLVTWTTAMVAPTADPAVAHALSALAFGAGSAAYVPPFALLIAGVAVPALLRGLLPRWFAATGLGIAVIGMISTATVLTGALDPTLPIGRFGGLLWMVAAGFMLRKRPS